MVLSCCSPRRECGKKRFRLVILRSLHAYRGQPRGFLIARATRIFPVYLLVFAVALAVRAPDYGLSAMPWIGPDSPVQILVSSGWPEGALVEIAAHLVMAHGLFPDAVLPHVWVRFLGAAWSLSTEWQFYVLALILAMRGMRDSRLVVFFLALAAAGLGWHTLAPEGWVFSRAFLPNKAQYFALGIASAAVLARARGAGVMYLAVLVATLAISFDQGGPGKMAAPLVWTFCLGAELGFLAPLAALLRHKALLWLGVVSYPLYIAHEPIHKMLCMLLSRVAGGDGVVFTLLWLPSAILLPLAVAWWLHRAVELPVQRWGRAIAAPRVVAVVGA